MISYRATLFAFDDFMKLNQDQKANLLNTATQVYKGYVALDFFKTRNFSKNQEDKNQINLLQTVHGLIRQGKIKENIVINGQTYELKAEPGADGKYSILLKRAILASGKSTRKLITSYDDNEALALLAEQNFCLEYDDQGKPQISNYLNEQMKLGGIGKIDLYPSHLVTLHNIIEKISAEEDITNLLVALATGSGKTFVQALWLQVLYLSGTNALFALPDKLIKQFRDDLGLLLPQYVIDELFVLRKNQECPEAVAALDSLKKKTEKPQIIISSSERLLDEHYQQLLEIDPNNTFLSFDEQHLLMKSERRRIRLIELSKKILSMFLTATPNDETYKLSGNKPVAIMSSGQKQAAGQGQFPVLFEENARNITDRNKLHTYRFWTGAFWENLYYGLLLRFSNAIQEEQSSPAVSIVESLPFYFHRDDEGNMHVPAARKLLIIIDNNEELINFCHALEQSDTNNRDVYRHGNLVNREDIANFFQLPKIDENIIRADMHHRREEYKRSLKSSEYAVGMALAKKSLKEQMQDTIFHNMVEYVLTDLTGLDELEHNRLRKADPAAFQRLIEAKFIKCDEAHYQRKLEKLIDPAGAQEISVLLGYLSAYMKNAASNPKHLKQFIENQELDTTLINKIKQSDNGFSRLFNAYTKRFLIMCTMSGMKNAEMPIDESRPFLGLNHDHYPMYRDGVLSEKAKRRQHTSLETLNDSTYESKFTPDYFDVTPEIAENYFRLGFTHLVSNEKMEGYSDRRLQTVINIGVDEPEKEIQIIGRNRGLDSTKIPAYIYAGKRKQKRIFDLKHLKSDDYYPELFSAQKKYNHEFIKILGTNVGQEIIDWYSANVHPDESIDHDQLKKQVLKIIAKTLREINNKNNHKINLSRAQLTKVINAAMGKLDDELARIKKPYSLSLSIKILGTVLNFLCEIYYTFKRIVPALKRTWHSIPKVNTAENAVSKTHPDRTYLKIIAKTNFKTVIKQINVAREFKDWMGRKSEGVITTIQNNLSSFLNGDLRTILLQHKKDTLLPLLGNFVIPAQQDLVIKALNKLPNMLMFLQENEVLVGKILTEDNPQFAQDVLDLFQKVPHLQELTLADIVNYPQQVNKGLELFKKNPLHLLKNEKPLQQSVVAQLAAYLQGDFITASANLFLDKDYQILKNILAEEGKAEQFILHLINETDKDESLDLANPELVVTEFARCFKLDDFASLKTRAEQCQKILDEEKIKLEDNIFANLSEDSLKEIARIFIDKLLPALVNVFPLSERKNILDSLTEPSVMDAIKNHGVTITSMMDKNESEANKCVSLFSLLCPKDTVLPAPLDVDKNIKETELFITNEFKKILEMNKAKLMAKKIKSFSFSTLLKPEYIYDEPIADFLKSDAFINAISPLLPFPQWIMIKERLKKDNASRINLARAIIDLRKNSQLENNLDPEVFITLMNTHFNLNPPICSSMDAVNNASTELLALKTKIHSSPIKSLNAELITHFAGICREQLIPLFASYIADFTERQKFLSQIAVDDDAALVQFVFDNKNKIELLQNNEDETSSINIALKLLNKLLPQNISLLTREQLVHPQIGAGEKGAQLIDNLMIKSVIGFLKSDYLVSFLEKLFNKEDYSKIITFLQSDENTQQLAQSIVAIGFDKLDQNKIIKLLKKESSLKDIQPFDERIGSFIEFTDELKSLKFDNLNKEKITLQIQNAFAPILFHKKFHSLVHGLIGYLNEEDLTIMFHAMGKDKPREKAVSLLKFINILKTKNYNGLKEYLTFPETASSIDDLPLKKTISLMANLFEEVLDCQCYYNQQDRKGDTYPKASPKLLNVVSQKAKQIYVEHTYSFFSSFSRKIFFIQAIRNGLPECSQINADANQSRAKVLERVKLHILRPLWWGTNMSNIGFATVKLGRDIAFGVASFGYLILNGFKLAANLVTNNYFIVSKRNPISKDYDDNAFTAAKEINNLSPFAAEHVARPECLPDVVTNVEHTIHKQPHSGFFATALKEQCDENVLDEESTPQL
jgi:hypothetical protein